MDSVVCIRPKPLLILLGRGEYLLVEGLRLLLLEAGGWLERLCAFVGRELVLVPYLLREHFL